MKRTVTLATGLVILMLPATLLAAGSFMQDGLWKITSTMDMPGMPFKMPPHTMTHCYTKEDLRRHESVVPQQKGDCTVTDFKRAGNKVTWKVACTGRHPGKGEGKIVFEGGTAYEGSMRLDSGGMVVTTNYKARRVSACQ